MASIQKRGKTYRVTVSNGRDIHGKQILETTTFIPDPMKTEKQNLKDLEVFAVEFEQRVKLGKYLDGEKITFQAFTETWLQDYARQRLEPTTVQAYQYLIDGHIMPALGHMKLAKIQPVHLNHLYNTMAGSRSDGKEGGYTAATIKRTHAVISSILETALKWNVITDNPCKRVSLPNSAKKEKGVQFFTLEDCGRFLQAVDADLAAEKILLQHKLFFHLAITCGLRRGELLALEWSDFNFNQNTVSITKSTGILHGKAFTKAPKNKTSVRVVSVPGPVMDLARTYQLQQFKFRTDCGTFWKGSNYVFIQDNGLQMYPTTPYIVFKKIIKRYNESAADPLPDIPLHGLRHTSATLLISQNTDIQTVSSRLGHAQTSTTMNIYSHQLKDLDRKAADTMANLLENPAVNQMLTKNKKKPS